MTTARATFPRALRRLPLLGFVLLPWTTLAYAVAQNEFGGLHDLGLILVVLAVLADIGVLGGGARQRRS
jgi:hypothetical protein